MLRRFLPYCLAGFVGLGLLAGAPSTGFPMGRRPLTPLAQVAPAGEEDQKKPAAKAPDKEAPKKKPEVKKAEPRPLPNPLKLLRERAVKDKTLAGAVFTAARFDAAGHVQVSGIATSEAQRKAIRSLLEQTLRAEKALKDKQTVHVEAMRVLDNRWLAKKLQEAFAGSDQPLLRETRIDLSEFRYHQTGKEELLLQLHVEGVSLAAPGSIKTLRDRLLTDANADIKLTPPLTEANLNTDKIHFLPNPTRTLQERIRSDEARNGILFTDAHYTKKGDLEIDVQVSSQKLNPVVEKLIQGANLQKEIRTPPGEDRRFVMLAKPMEWTSDKVKDWPAFVRALQTSLSKSEGDAGRILRQTRLEGASFQYEKDREKPVLVLEGVTLFDSRALLAGDKALEEKNEEARARLVQSAVDRVLRKPGLDAVRARVQADARKLLPPLDYDVGVDGLKFIESPYESLQHHLKRTGILLIGFEFDEEGKLQPLSALELTPERRKLISQAVQKFGPAVLNPSAAKKEADKTSKTTSRGNDSQPVGRGLIPVAFLDEGAGKEEAAPDPRWAAQVRAWRKQASESIDVLLRKTRLDQASLDYDDSGKVVLNFEGCCLGGEKDRAPLAARLEALTKDSLRLGRSYRVAFDPRTFRFAPDPVLALQQQVVSRNLDGLLFHNSRYDVDGVLHIDVLLGSDSQQSAADEILKDQPIPEDVLLSKESNREQRFKVGPSRIFSWQRMLKDVRDQFAEPADNLLARHTRLDRASFAYGKDVADLELRWEGVCIHPTDDSAEVRHEAIARRIKDSRGPMPPVPFTVVTAGVALLDNPTRALQQRLLTSAPVNDGILFEDAWYPADGRLQLLVLLADPGQQKIVDQVIRDNPLPARVVARTPGETMHPLVVRTFDLRSVLQGLQKRLAAAEGIVGRIRVGRGWFSYPAAPRDAVQFHVGGVLLGPINPELKKAVDDQLTKETLPALPRIAARSVQVRSELVVRANPTRGLQELVAGTPALDGVGISNASFDPDGNLFLTGVWRSKEQQPALHTLAADFLRGERFVRSADEFQERCKQVRTQDVLDRLRQWTADALDEVWIERLYFDKNGLLTIRGVVAGREEEKAIRAKLIQLINDDPQLKGAFTVGGISAIDRKEGVSIHAVVYRQPLPPPLPGTEPGVELRVRPPVTPLLRRLVQWPVNLRQIGPPRRWDGVVLRRGYYTADGRFGLEGLCDSVQQRATLGEMMRALAEDASYRTAFAGGVDLSRLRVLPLGPMLDALRRVMPAYPILDSVTLDSACHDVDNRLVLRVIVVGPRPREPAVELLRRLIAADARWRDRVDVTYLRMVEVGPGSPGPLRLDMIERLRLSDTVAGPLILKAIATLRRGVGDLSTRYCQEVDPVRILEYRVANVASALPMLNVALQYDTSDATAWYLRALCYYVQGDLRLCERDLRRMVEIELYAADADVRRRERLRMLEHLQGDFRRELEILRKRIVRDVLTGKPPLRVTDIP